MKTTLNPIRILLADDHPVLRQGIQALASDERDMQFVAEASNGLEAIEQFRKHRPDIALLDLEMPGVNGIDAMIAIRNEFPDARIIILTTYAGDVRISRALKAGAPDIHEEFLSLGCHSDLLALPARRLSGGLKVAMPRNACP